MPLSVTTISKKFCNASLQETSLPIERLTCIFPPSGVYLKALESTFIKTLSKLFKSIHAFSWGISCIKAKSIFFLCAIYSNGCITSIIKPIISVSWNFMNICPLSNFLISISWLINRRMRWALRYIIRYVLCNSPLFSPANSFSNGLMIKVIGVRISWDIFIKNCNFASFNCSSCSRFIISRRYRTRDITLFTIPHTSNAASPI